MDAESFVRSNGDDLPKDLPSELLALGLRTIGDREPPLTEWLIKGTVPKVGTGLLAGQYSAGKTFTAIDIAMHIMHGVPYWGRKTEKAGILWIAAEGSGGLESRIRAARLGKFTAEGAAIKGDLFILIHDAPKDMNSQDGVKWFEKIFRASAAYIEATYELPIGLVLIDTMGKAFGFKDQNDNAEADKMMRELDACAKRLSTMIMPVAHVGKDAEGGPRGASGFGAGVDTIIMVGADNDGRGTVAKRYLALSKQREGETGPIGEFELVSHEVRMDGDNEPVMSCYVQSQGGVSKAAVTETPTEKKIARSVIAFHAAFVAALNESDLEFPNLGKVVESVAILNKFSTAYVTGETDDVKRRKAVSSAFKYALGKAVSLGTVRVKAVNDAEYIYQRDPDDLTGATTH